MNSHSAGRRGPGRRRLNDSREHRSPCSPPGRREGIDPISIFIGLTRRDLTSQALRYFLFGEGETGLLVYKILLPYWDWAPEEDVRPLIFLMSD